jgi:succinate-semialdehyde dehydrogenase/glutarate-semialdehyde dehydrogenase
VVKGLVESRAGFIDGEWVAARSGQVFEVHNPSTGELVGCAADMDAVDAARAIDAAAEALPAWKAMSPAERSEILLRWRELTLEHKEDIAELITAEQGKPLNEAIAEVEYGASFLQWYSEEGKRIYGETIPADSPNRRFMVIKQPVGVCAAIAPWNFPFAIIVRKVAPALAAGCTMVVKPAEQAPLCSLAIAELAHRAGVPAGVLNMIPCQDPEGVGGELCDNPKVRKLSFTGSTEVGKRLLARSAATVKKVTLELGGQTPFIIFEDADLDDALTGALASKFRNAGQTCVCANRFFVQEEVYDEFAGMLVDEVKAINVGDGMESGTRVGPLIDRDALEKVERHVADAVAKGAKILTGGKRHALGGTFFEPTVLTDVTPDMDVAREETFGPIAALLKFTDEDEAVRLANDTRYGLAAYVYTRDIGRVWRVPEALEYGMIGVNTGGFSTPTAPLGGIKESGLGREGARQGIEQYLEEKYLCLGGIDKG